MPDYSVLLHPVLSFAIAQLGDQAKDFTDWLSGLTEYRRSPPRPFLGPNGEDWAAPWGRFQKRWKAQHGRLTDQEKWAIHMLEITCISTLVETDSPVSDVYVIQSDNFRLVLNNRIGIAGMPEFSLAAVAQWWEQHPSA